MTLRLRNLVWAALAIGLVLTFDAAMRADQANLCGNDATAFKECSE